MTTTQALTCHNCGDMLIGEYADNEHKLGRCCANLPEPWDQDRNGRYIVRRPTFGNELFGETEEEEQPIDVRPRCRSCGEMEFYARVTGRSYGTICASAAAGDNTLRIDLDSIDYDDSDDEVTEIECASCGSLYRGEWSWS
jgi:hypothetical protein